MAALGLGLALAWGLSHGRVIVHPGAILHQASPGGWNGFTIPYGMTKSICTTTTSRKSRFPQSLADPPCVCRHTSPPQHGQDEAIAPSTSPGVPSSSPTPQPLCCAGGRRAPAALREPLALSPSHAGMASLIVVTDATGSASEEEMDVPGTEGCFGDGRKLHLSGRKLSLQERPQPARSPGSGNGANERFIYPSLPYSPVTSPHSSPRLPRRPTVESNRVSITGLQVRGMNVTCEGDERYR